jgi:hypothetical protein
MKLRIKGNSLRLRVSRTEVARLLAGECLEETIYFAPHPEARLTYALGREPSLTSPTVRYAESRVAILIPAGQTNTWGVTGQIGISETISLGELGSLELFVEKDFACLDRSDEENEDTFENPNAVEMCVASH